MRARFSAVIGTNYGDEGKGRTVDLLTERASSDTLVIRHNSGGQAGHTVERAGARHVFNHVGSGTLLGAETLLGPNFVVNPLIFNMEWHALSRLGITPKVYVDQRCRVTTPFDVTLNQAREISRGSRRHGSCGTGFGETIARYERLGERARTLLAEVENYARDCDALISYFKEEHPYKHHLGTSIEERSFSLVEGFYKQFVKMLGCITLVDSEAFLKMKAKQDYNILFEGAQGLLLHQDHPNFPHVTRCRTGLEDVVNLLGLARIETPLTAYYCTRSYVTRHGSGPLLDELTFGQMSDLGYQIEDATNAPNAWQGSLRYAVLNPTRVRMQVASDITRAKHENPGVTLLPYVALSCADQAPPLIVSRLEEQLRPVIVSRGPSAADSKFSWDELPQLTKA